MSTAIIETRVTCATCDFISSNGTAECSPCYGKRTGTIYDLGTGEWSLPAAIRARYEEESRRPGKFTGEPGYVPYFYDQALNGFGGEWECHCSELGEEEVSLGCECDSHWETFTVSAGDVLIFPELAGRASIRLYVASSGFVSED